MVNPQFIVFFGPDGSGKTTQARLLKSHLKKEGFRVRLVWIRAHHSLASILSKVLVILGYYHIVFLQGRNHKSFDVKLLPRLKAFWGFIEFVSVLPWILIKVKLQLFLGYIVIADRYLVDTIVNVAYFLDDPNFLRGDIARILLNMISKDAFLIHLDAKTEIVFARIEKRKSEEIDVKFIKFQQRAYLLLAAYLGALSIDTSHREAADTFKIILDKLTTQKRITRAHVSEVTCRPSRVVESFYQ